MELNEILAEAIRNEASDVLLKAGVPPAFRVRADFLPLEGAAILLAIDQIMDMGRTAVNVMGNCIATAVVARWEGVFDDARMRAFADGIESRAA